VTDAACCTRVQAGRPRATSAGRAVSGRGGSPLPLTAFVDQLVEADLGDAALWSMLPALVKPLVANRINAERVVAPDAAAGLYQGPPGPASPSMSSSVQHDLLAGVTKPIEQASRSC